MLLNKYSLYIAAQPHNALLVIFIASFLLLPGTALGEEADVDLTTRQQGQVWAGEQLTLNLDIKTNGQSFSDVFFDLPEVTGAFLLRTDSSTVKLTEQRGSDSWQVLRYPLSLFVPQGRTIKVPAFEVRFQTSRGFGTEPTTHKLLTPALELDVTQPPGVDAGDMVVSSPGLEVNYTWTLPAEPVKPGDALTLTVERRSERVSAMLLPPLPVFETPGLASYPAAPELDDRSNRGALVGERRDRITWIVEQAGSYDIPAVRFRWWDPQRERLEDQIIEGASFEVVAPPATAPAGKQGQPPATRIGRHNVVMWATLVLVIGSVLVWLRQQHAGLWRRILPQRRTLLAHLNPNQRSSS